MKNKVVVIGGINIDICNQSNTKLIYGESNIGSIKLDLGGVGYNLFINLKRLDVDVDFISAVGDDLLSEYTISLLQKNNINTTYVKQINNLSMSIYSYVLDDNNDMLLAINDMKPINYLDVNYLESIKDVLDQYDYIVIDTNLNQSVIDWLLNNYQNKILVDGVSYIKVKKLINHLDKINTLKVNHNELLSLLNDDQIKNWSIYKQVWYLTNKYPNLNLFVSNGIDGVYFNYNNKIYKVKNKPIQIVNASGAGDALASGIFYSVINNLNKKQQITNGFKIVNLTLKSEKSTSEYLDKHILSKGGEKYEWD